MGDPFPNLTRKQLIALWFIIFALATALDTIGKDYEEKQNETQTTR